jgi:RimJ/RimL family protein N-acetyltransferase
MKQERDLSISLRTWSEVDLPLLEKLMGDSVMTEYLGGPETTEQLANRHQRYLKLADSGKGHMFVIVNSGGASVGSIGCWDTEWEGQPVYETGWSVLPAFQGQGIASQAIKAILEVMQAEAKYRFVHAFPSILNGASNAICKKAGFTFIEEAEFEYPPGNMIRCNNWRFDLQADNP